MDTLSAKQFQTLLAERARESRIPLQGMFELTPVCNLDCKMCYVHLPQNVAKQRMLSGDQWIALMDEAMAAGMLYALLTGGEALTHPDFWRIYDHLKHNGIRVQLKSNGILLCGDNLEKLVRLPPNPIDISLYGCNAESYRAVTGSDVFDRVTQNIRAALDAGLHIRLMVTPSRALMPWLEDTLRFAKGFGVPVLVSEQLFAPREETGRKLENFSLTVEEYCEIRRITKSILQTEPVPFDDGAIGPEKRRNPVAEKGLPCVAGRSMFAVRWTGQMTPCLGFAENLMETDPMQVGFEEAWQRIGQEVEAYAIPQDCLECDVKDICHYCPPLHGENAIHHLCDKEYCRYVHLRKTI